MATIKLKFRPSTVVGKEGTLYYQVTHHRLVRQLRTTYHVFPHEWSVAYQQVRICGSETRKAELFHIREQLNWEMHRMSDVLVAMDLRYADYSITDLIAALYQLPPCQTVFCFIQKQIDSLMRKSRIGTARTYEATLNSLRKFRKGKDLYFTMVSSDLMEQYESSMMERGLMRNTTSFYLRTFRTIYNMAVEIGLTDDKRIFRHVYTGFDKTDKRAISLRVMRTIKHLDLSFSPSLDFARDTFLLSFYLRGMPFVDMAYLPKTALKNGYIKYRRRKTGQMLSIGWERPMQEILIKYKTVSQESPYLFPFITRADGTERLQYLRMLHKVNRNLKHVARMVGLRIPLTTYVARHTWASAAYGMRIPLSVIREGMGHDCERTTQIYLASLDSSVIDKANKKILNNLK